MRYSLGMRQGTCRPDSRETGVGLAGGGDDPDGETVLHLIKLCVGVASPADLARWQSRRAETRHAQGLDPRPRHRTRNMPRRRREVLDGGSLYWVIRHEVRLRQRIAAIEPGQLEDGRSCATLILEPELVHTEPVLRRPFQGWRYLDPRDAPPDLAWQPGDSQVCPELQVALAQLGLRVWTGTKAGT